MKTHIGHNEALMRDGRALRDKLALSGDRPEVKRKLDHLVDEQYLTVALGEKLKRILRDNQ